MEEKRKRSPRIKAEQADFRKREKNEMAKRENRKNTIKHRDKMK